MLDQAAQLRQLAAQVDVRDDTPAPSRGQPHIVAVTAGKGGVGTTTVALGLATAFASAGHEILLADANFNNPDIATACGLALQSSCTEPSGLNTTAWGPHGLHIVTNNWTALHTHTRHADPTAAVLAATRSAEFDIVVIDAGSGLSRQVRDVWHAASQVVLVTGIEVIAAMDAYAALKLMGADRDVPVSTVVNGTDNTQIATAIQERIAQACHRFLGRQLQAGGQVPRDRQLACRAAGLQAGWSNGDSSEANNAFLQLAHHITCVANQIHDSTPNKAPRLSATMT
jgi:flagellar biosynthesis protein FlhG